MEFEHLPVYGNLKDLLAELDIFAHLVRSPEEWAVASKMNEGQFVLASFQAVLHIGIKLNDFIMSANASPQSISQLMRRKLDAEEAKTGGPSFEGELVIRGVPLDGPRLEKARKDLKAQPSATPNPFHQDILRSLHLEAALIEALMSIDYNVAFKMDIPKEYQYQSRDYLLKISYNIVEILGNFIRGNTKSQDAVFKFLPSLRKLMGILKRPEECSREDKAIQMTPGLNTEKVRKV